MSDGAAGGARLPPAFFTERPRLAALLDALDRDGEEARVVGGAVRNALLGLAPTDVDVTTTATPAEVTRRARAAGFKVVPTGIEHGTVTCVSRGEAFEVTTLREDVETDGRRAVVRFGRDFADDARRRDFTMNALCATRDGRVHDAVGGLADLAAGRVRFVGEAARRVAEDRLRALRFFRFAAWYGRGPLDAEGLSACVGARDDLALLSAERVRAEVLKLLLAPDPVPTVAAMAGCGLLARVLGGVAASARLRALLASAPPEPGEGEAALRLGALAAEVAEDAARLRARLRLSNAETATLEAAAAAATWLRAHRGAPPPGALAALLHRRGPATLRLAAALARAGARDEAEAAARAAAFAPFLGRPAPRAPFRGADLVALGVPKGPRVGAALARAEAAWVAAGFPEEPAAVAAILRGAAGA